MFGSTKRRKQDEKCYALCERITASATSPHHIRQLTSIGMKKSGGADTLAFCGAKVAWDTSEVTLDQVPAIVKNQHASYWICAQCVTAAAELAR